MLTDSEGSNHLDYQDHGKSKCERLFPAFPHVHYAFMR